MAATHVEEGLGFAEALGYPVVLKPANLAGSVGVVRCDSPREFERAWAQVMGSSHPRFGTPTGLLVEEYLDGGEVSVESIVHEGTCYPVVITRKFLGAPPGFEEVGHIVSAADTEAHDEAVVGLAVAAHRALGIEHGATHAEVRLTSQGPRMVEIGARLAGDMIPLLAHVATGVDLTTAAAQVACGQMPDLQRSRQAAAGVRFFYPDTDVRVRGLGLRHGFAPAWLERIDWKAVPGDELRLPPRGFLGRLGFALVSGRDSQECLERLDAVEAALELDLEPLPLDPDVAHVVRGALSEQCVPNVDPATIGDGAGVGSNVLPVSSMGYLRALIRIEEDLGIEFAEDLLLEIHEPTVGDIVARAMGALGMAR
jgi:biotin carboxylase